MKQSPTSPSWKEPAGLVTGACVVIAVVLLLGYAVSITLIWLLWNAVGPSAVGGPQLSWLQTAGIFFLVTIVVGVIGNMFRD